MIRKVPVLSLFDGLHAIYLHNGVLEIVEIDWFETLELRVSATEVIEYRRHSLVVVVDVDDDRLDSLHEPHRMTLEPCVTDQLLAFQMTETEDGLNERISTEY